MLDIVKDENGINIIKGSGEAKFPSGNRNVDIKDSRSYVVNGKSKLININIGVQYYKDGSKYEGDSKNGKKHGRGNV